MTDSIPPDHVACAECGDSFSIPALEENQSFDPDSIFLCEKCEEMLLGRAEETLPARAVHVMTVKSAEGSEVVYVPVKDDLVLAEDLEPTETESTFASEVVQDLGEMLELDLEEWGDPLQELVEDVVLAVRESVLHVAQMTISPADFEKLAKLIREGA